MTRLTPTSLADIKAVHARREQQRQRILALSRHINHTPTLDITFTPGWTDTTITEADDAFTTYLDNVDPLRILHEWAGTCPYRDAGFNRKLMARVWAARRNTRKQHA